MSTISTCRLIASRVALGTALLLLVMVQFMSAGGGRALGGIWVVVWEAVREAFSGHWKGEDLLAIGVLVFVHLFVAAQVFLAGFYMRARPILWIARFVVVGPWAWLLAKAHLRDILNALGSSVQPGPEFCLFWIFALLPIGLFLIPHPGAGKEIGPIAAVD